MNVLSLTYLGNVQYFTKLCFSECVIDIGEHYLKQSYRTRCDILTAGGPKALTIPVIKGSNWDKPKMKEVRIDYSKRWQHQHWGSIVSAYKSSPYFDYYADGFEPFYMHRCDLLCDFNTGLTELVLKLLGSGVQPVFSEDYIDVRAGSGDANSPAMITDLRDAISPKPRLSHPDPDFHPEPYWQVFAGERGFVPNLSIIDLLFCEGPATIGILERCIKGNKY